MRVFVDSLRERHLLLAKIGISVVCCTAVIATVGLVAFGQAPTQPESNQLAPSGAQTQAAAPSPTGFASALTTPSSSSSSHQEAGTISDDQIKQLLLGKTLYLRDAYLDNTLNFDERGRFLGHSPQGSYTLSEIKINKVKVSRRKVELEGDRYAMHFLGSLASQDPLKDVDKVKITPKKKIVKIAIDREQVEKPKKEKDKGKPNHEAASTAVKPVETARDFQYPSESKSFSSTTSPAHASRLLVEALDRVFAQGIDDRMIAAMPDFWKLYYQAAASKRDYKPSDPGILYQSMVDQKAKLVSTLEPPSNEYAQANAVAGIALYHAVVGSDGKANEVVVARPIGFGLDEGAVQTIRQAKFEPAIKDGKPVPVALDLVVSFRIFSKRTSEPAVEPATDTASKPILPGPYSVLPN
jgi:outer membrane biosynthesis protein TonB